MPHVAGCTCNTVVLAEAGVKKERKELLEGAKLHCYSPTFPLMAVPVEAAGAALKGL
jgi:hypothetical protein